MSSISQQLRSEPAIQALACVYTTTQFVQHFTGPFEFRRYDDGEWELISTENGQEISSVRLLPHEYEAKGLLSHKPLSHGEWEKDSFIYKMHVCIPYLRLLDDALERVKKIIGQRPFVIPIGEGYVRVMTSETTDVIELPVNWQELDRLFPLA